MTDKTLSELEWKKFSKGRDLKDAALLKGLVALEKADKDPAARLEALDHIEKQSEQLRKAARNDKELKTFLDDMEKAVEKQRRQARLDEKTAGAETEEEETPALLTTKMTPLLRDIRKGDVMQALIATAGKSTAVLLSRRAIAPTRRKLLVETLGQTGGIKYITGECLFEEKAHTFVVKTEVAGLAKKLRAALLEQTGLRLKVRVRGDDPALVDADGEDGEAADHVEADHAEAAHAEAAVAQVRSHLRALAPQIQKAVVNGGDRAAITALVSQLKERMEVGDGREAQSLLKALVRTLIDAKAATGPSLVQLQGARLNWETTRAALRQRLRALELAMLAHFEGETEAEDARAAAGLMNDVLEELDEDLIDILDEALNESDPGRRKEIQAEARLCIDDYAAFVKSSPLVADLDTNPFTAVNIRETVLRSVGELHATLG